jgi:hypothetical protein
MPDLQTTKKVWTAADILWESDPHGCQMSVMENGRVIVHPDQLEKAQRLADRRNEANA